MPALLTATRELTEFASVYRENFAFVWRSLRRLGVPERDLPDATHDVFLVAHARFADFDGRHRASTWLFAIGLRIASDRRRKASTRYEVYGEEGEPPGRVEQDPIAERRAMLQRCLDAMPLEQRAVFVAFDLEGMTGEELA